VSGDSGIIEQISDILRSMNVLPPTYAGKITADTSITRDLKLDSLAVMDFVMELETRFDTIISIDRLSGVETVGDLAKLLETQPIAHSPSGLE